VKITTPEQDNAIILESKAHPFKSAVDIKKDMNEDISASISTYRRRLVSAGLPAYRPARKPRLSPINVQKRLDWALLHKEWTYDDNWKHIIYADESTFNLSKCAIQYVRRPAGKRYDSKYINAIENKSKANVNVWGAFSSYGYSNLIRIDGRCDAQAYVNILSENLLNNYNALLPEGGFFVHDNCPIHSARVTKEWLRNNNIVQLEHPPISPDLNSIEHVWAELSKHLEKIDILFMTQTVYLFFYRKIGYH
jgi:hypothetical protein